MNIKTLTIKHYKGFEQSFTLDTEGKNVLIWVRMAAAKPVWYGLWKTSLTRAVTK